MIEILNVTQEINSAHTGTGPRVQDELTLQVHGRKQLQVDCGTDHIDTSTGGPAFTVRPLVGLLERALR